ncbi:MAG: HupE/UreJ family protein [Pseudomonadota bacterium]
MRTAALFLVSLAGVALPEIAAAHLVSNRFGELYSGILHPLTSLQHVVPWLGLGLLAGMLKSDASRWALAVFPLAVGVGTLTASFLPESDVVAAMNLASFILLGALIAFAARLPRPWFLGLAVIVGLSHGYANGTRELEGGALLLYVSGVVIAGYAVIALVSAVSHFVSREMQWGSVAVRAVGSWIAAVGLVFGAYTVLTPAV